MYFFHAAGRKNSNFFKITIFSPHCVNPGQIPCFCGKIVSPRVKGNSINKVLILLPPCYEDKFSEGERYLTFC
uniref:Uncharacterized protein n=1 Tax=Saccharolobus islandicus TaxID=43080 RepID=Q9P9K1_SACIS|nr:hypothetical protein [Sulfolobus islandicus]